LIEADKNRYAELVKNVSPYDCVCINEFVSYPADNTLEKILERNNITDDIDFLSIDIDGDDYYVLESLTKLKPKVICCEYNPTVPFHMSLVGQRGSRFGCSARALTELAEKKGYCLVAVTHTNCIYVLDEYAERFNDYQTDITVLQMDFIARLNYIITDYSGRYVTNKASQPYGFTKPCRTHLRGDKTYALEKTHSLVYRIKRKLRNLRPTRGQTIV
jgi:hypothetical protein